MTEDELKTILASHAYWVMNKQSPSAGRQADLDGQDLSGADLSKANLSGAFMRHAKFVGANLSGADLRQADFEGSDLSGANLRRANLSHACFVGANLTGADFTESDLTMAWLQTANLTNAILMRVTMYQTDARLVNFKGATLSGMVNACDFQGAVFDGAYLTVYGNSRFVGADLRGARFCCSYLPVRSLSGAAVDRLTASQVALAFVNLQCDDPDFLAVRDVLLRFSEIAREDTERNISRWAV